MFEDPDVLVCFRGDLVWFLDTLKPSVTEFKAGILWKPKTKNKVCKLHAQSPKKTYIAREEKPVLKEYAYFGDFRASFPYQFKLDGTVGISDSLTFLLLTTKRTYRALPFRLVNIRCFRHENGLNNKVEVPLRYIGDSKWISSF